MHTTKRHYPVIYGWDGVGDTQVTGQSVAKPRWSTFRKSLKGRRGSAGKDTGQTERLKGAKGF